MFSDEWTRSELHSYQEPRAPQGGHLNSRETIFRTSTWTGGDSLLEALYCGNESQTMEAIFQRRWMNSVGLYLV